MSLSGAARQKFDKLLRLATKSTFAGERANALAAARRLAGKHGMSLGEAARADPAPRAEPEVERAADRPRPDYRYRRPTRVYGNTDEKVEALRAYARMRQAEEKERQAEERVSTTILFCIVLIFGAFGLIAMLSTVVVGSFDAEQGSSGIGGLKEWVGQYF